MTHDDDELLKETTVPTRKNSKTPSRRGRPPGGDATRTRQKILDAALTLFAERGYDLTTVKDIAAAVGVKDSALYGHFASKHDILQELLQTLGPNAMRSSLASLDLDVFAQDPRQAMKQLLVRILERWMDPREQRFFRLLLRENLRTPHDHAIDLVALTAESRARLAIVARRLMQLGILRDDVEPDWLAEQFVAPVAWLRVLRLTLDERPFDLAELTRLTDRHVDQFFKAFVKTKP